MPFRVQPTDFVAPPHDPFANDTLNRRESVLAMTEILGQIEGPCVMAVDASWGMGKTTLLRIWAQHLRDEGFPVVEFNAWETDFTWDPFLALWSELSEQLPNTPPDGSPDRLSALAAQVSSLMRKGTYLSLSSGLAVLSDADPAIAGLTPIALDAATVLLRPNDRSDEFQQDQQGVSPLEAPYLEAKQALLSFRNVLEQNAYALTARSAGHPLIVLVDELDRCKPTYAVELLETAKHIFSTDHIVFVLCLDREQLSHSVKAVYGSQFNSDGYLRRFFDIDFRLPKPSRIDFITEHMHALGIPEVLDKMNSRAQYRSITGEAYSDQDIATILDLSPLSLRDLQQTLTRLNLLLRMFSDRQRFVVETKTVLLILRMIDSTLYRRLVSGTATDEEAVAAFRLPVGDTRERPAMVRRIVESVVSACVCLASADTSGYVSDSMTPLLRRYRNRMDSISTGPPQLEREKQNAEMVVKYVRAFCGDRDDRVEGAPVRVRDELNFRSAVTALELLPE